MNRLPLVSIWGIYVKALSKNLPITLVNYSNGTHGFDTSIDNDLTRQIIKNTIEFWKFNFRIKQQLTLTVCFISLSPLPARLYESSRTGLMSVRQGFCQCENKVITA